MATQRKLDEHAPGPKVKLPPPVPGALRQVGGLGWWIDDLMGATRALRAAEQELLELFEFDEEWEDPPQIEPPEDSSVPGH
jgi:hypothetical protein